jgi:predicted small metal-binding protein
MRTHHMKRYAGRNYCLQCNWSASTRTHSQKELTHRLIRHMAEHDGYHVIAEPLTTTENGRQ